MGLMAFTFAFTLFACASLGKNEAMTASNSADPVKESTSEVKDNTASDNKDNNGADAVAEDTDVLTAADEEPSGEPVQEESGEEHKTMPWEYK